MLMLTGTLLFFFFFFYFVVLCEVLSNAAAHKGDRRGLLSALLIKCLKLFEIPKITCFSPPPLFSLMFPSHSDEEKHEP